MRKIEQQIVELIPRLRRYANALWCGDDQSAEDLVQDCLERALSRLQYWQRGTDLRAWLFTIMHNVHANKIRRLGSAPVFTPFVDEHHDHTTTKPEQSLLLRDLLQGLSRLSNDQREILLLVTLEGLRYEDVAVVMDVPVGTIMSRLSRARERLREFMKDETKIKLKRVK